MEHQESNNSVAMRGAGQAKSYSCRVTRLQEILSAKQNRRISYDEAEEVADSLISFYEVLAETEPDDCRELGNMMAQGV